MRYLVRGQSNDPGTGEALIPKDTREDALATALDFLKQGIPVVTIVSDGRSYAAEEFAQTLGED